MGLTSPSPPPPPIRSSPSVIEKSLPPPPPSSPTINSNCSTITNYGVGGGGGLWPVRTQMHICKHNSGKCNAMPWPFLCSKKKNDRLSMLVLRLRQMQVNTVKMYTRWYCSFSPTYTHFANSFQQSQDIFNGLLCTKLTMAEDFSKTKYSTKICHLHGWGNIWNLHC